MHVIVSMDSFLDQGIIHAHSLSQTLCKKWPRVQCGISKLQVRKKEKERNSPKRAALVCMQHDDQSPI